MFRTIFKLIKVFCWMFAKGKKLKLARKYEKEGRMVVAFEEAIGALVHTACRDKDSFGAICLALEIYNNVNIYFDILPN